MSGSCLIPPYAKAAKVDANFSGYCVSARFVSKPERLLSVPLPGEIKLGIHARLSCVTA